MTKFSYKISEHKKKEPHEQYLHVYHGPKSSLPAKATINSIVRSFQGTDSKYIPA